MFECQFTLTLERMLNLDVAGKNILLFVSVLKLYPLTKYSLRNSKNKAVVKKKNIYKAQL